MELGVFLSQDSGIRVAEEAEKLGFAVALAPEGFKSDAASLLGAAAARTSTIGLGSGVMQIPGRTPVMTALTAATIDGLSGGRFRLGLGVSNPDVSHGWYGVPWDKPLQRTREYVEIVRMALRGEPVRYQGKQYQLPPEGATEAAHLRAAPIRADIPIYLAGVGPASLELTGEIADGWIGVMCPPERLEESLIRVRKGREKVGKDLTGFEVLPSVPISVGADPREAAKQTRGYFANFIGLGSKDRSIYSKLVTDMGFGEAADEIRAHNRAGDRAAAAAAVPFELLDQTSLLGSAERIAPRMRQYAEAGVTILGLTPLAVGVEAQLDILRTAAEALRLSKI